ncbi:MAG: aldo/keto reductase [Anaerolineales bacterium]|jgi:aryl-alcohol dehydrogenase-like predicted oxidoreductase
MEKTNFGKTDLMVSRLGVGMSELGHEHSQDNSTRAKEILNFALDSGINFLDTAACYGNGEELIGRTISDRRDEFVLSTKAGHLSEGYSGHAWTAQTVRDSIERSLKRMDTDHVDIVHLHSCSIRILEEGDVIRTLQDAKKAGKTRYIGYSGDNEAAEWAVESDLFDSLQTSFNLVDQKAYQTKLLSRAKEKGLGIIAKRPIANAVWDTKGSPSSYAREYYQRARIMSDPGPVPDEPRDSIQLALGFVLAHDEVDTAIVGTSDPQHMRENIEWFYNHPQLDDKTIVELHQRFEKFGSDWTQEG